MSLILVDNRVEYRISGPGHPWLISFEKGVKSGDVRYIAGELMYARTIDCRYRPYSFTSLKSINWSPVNKTIDFDKWKNGL